VVDGGSAPVPGDTRTDRVPGWRDVLTVSAAIVAIVLGAAAVTGFLPPAGQDLVFRTPLAIVVIIVGTVWLLVRLARRPSPEDRS